MGETVENRVNTRLTAEDAASGILDRVGGALGGIGSAIGRVTSMFNPLNLAIGGLASALSISKITELGSQFESTQNQMAGFLNSLGVVSGGFGASLSVAADTMEQIRVAAAALPGEAEEYVEVFKAGLPTVAKAVGGTISQMTEFTNRYTAITKTLGVDVGQAARDLGLMLRAGTGAAGMDVRSFTQLLPFMRQVAGFANVTRESFNKLNEQARAGLLQKTFEKLDPMIENASNSFDAMWGGLQSNMKALTREGTGALFDRIKEALGDINEYFDQNRTMIITTARIWGERVAQAFDKGRAIIETWGPKVVAFGGVLYDRVVGVWEKVEPAVERVGVLIGKALDDPNGTIDKLVHLAELWAGLKTVQLVGSAAGGMFGGGGAGQTAGLLVQLGTAIQGIPAAAAAAGAGLQQAAVLASNFGLMVEGAGGGVSGVLGVLGTAVSGSAALIGGTFLAAVGGVSAALWQAKGLYDDLHEDEMQTSRARAEAAMREIRAYADLDASMGELKERQSLLSQQMGRQGDETAQALFDVAFAAEEASGAFANASARISSQLQQWADKRDKGIADNAWDSFSAAIVNQNKKLLAGTLHDKKTPTTPGARGGGGRAVQDFRYSRFDITQKFAEGYDPDKIALAFTKSVEDSVDYKLQSGFSPANTVR